MTDVRVVGIDKLINATQGKLKSSLKIMLRDKKLRKQVGEIIVAGIKAHPMATAGSATQKIRSYFEKYNTVDPDYQRSKIKAVFTGALLQDLVDNVLTDTTKNAFVVEQSKKSYPKYKTKNGRTKKIKTFKYISERLYDLGYEYIDLRDNARERVRALIISELKKIINKEFIN